MSAFESQNTANEAKSAGPIDIRWYGAKCDGVTDDTAAIEAAIAAAPVTGARIICSGICACNVTVKKSNITLEGESHGGAQTGAEYTFGLVPFNPDLPVLQIGDDTHNVSGFEASKFSITHNGPNGSGKYGLRVYSAMRCTFSAVRVAGFTKKSVWIENGPNYPVVFIRFQAFSLDSAASGAEHTLYVAQNAAQYTAAIWFTGGDISAPGVSGRAIELVSPGLAVPTFIDMANVWVQCGNGRNVVLSGNCTIYGAGVHIDSSLSTDTLVECTLVGNNIPAQFLRGDITVDGKIKFADGSLVSQETTSCYGYQPQAYNQLVYGNVYLATTADTSVRTTRIFRSSTALWVKNEEGYIALDAKTGFYCVFDGVNKWSSNSTDIRPAGDNSFALGTSSARFSNLFATQLRPGDGSTIITSGAGSPEGVLAAPVGSQYADRNNGTLYIKEGGGAGNTGWVASAAKPTLYAIDSNDRIVWSFDESTGTYANSGSAGAYSATVQSGTGAIGNQNGKLSACVYVSGATRVGGPDSAAAKVATNAITLAGWIFVKTGFSWAIYKRYRTLGSFSGWTEPYVTCSLGIEADGKLTFQVTIGADGVGTRFSVTTSAPAVATGNWAHVGVSFDAAEGIARFYVNGVKVYTSAVLATGNIDWNTVDPGGWNVGCSGNGNEAPQTFYDSFRVCDVKRSDAWFASLFASERGS